MAIKRDLPREKTEIRAALPNSYTKVHDVEIRLSAGGQVWLHVLTFADAAARADKDACSVNKETVKVTLARFIAVGQPAGWERDQIIAAAYAVLKADGFAGEDC